MGPKPVCCDEELETPLKTINFDTTNFTLTDNLKTHSAQTTITPSTAYTCACHSKWCTTKSARASDLA